MANYNFYIAEPKPSDDRHIPDSVIVQVWRPSIRWPIRTDAGLSAIIFSIFHWIGLFSNSHFGMLCILHEGRMVHHSMVSPRYFRFPDMSVEDIQIGAVFTDSSWRGRGLGSFAIREIMKQWRIGSGRIWYITDQDNTASIKLAENAGFKLHGTGIRQSKFGLGILGQYRVTATLNKDSG